MKPVPLKVNDRVKIMFDTTGRTPHVVGKKGTVTGVNVKLPVFIDPNFRYNIEVIIPGELGAFYFERAELRKLPAAKR